MCPKHISCLIEKLKRLTGVTELDDLCIDIFLIHMRDKAMFPSRLPHKHYARRRELRNEVMDFKGYTLQPPNKPRCTGTRQNSREEINIISTSGERER